MRNSKVIIEILSLVLIASVYSTCVKGLSESLSTDPLVREQGGPLVSGGGGGSSGLKSRAQDLILALVARGASQKQADGVVQVSAADNHSPW